MDERMVERIEAAAMGDMEYKAHMSEAIRHLDSLIEKLDPASREALHEIEIELALAQGVAIRKAFIQGVEAGKRLLHTKE